MDMAPGWTQTVLTHLPNNIICLPGFKAVAKKIHITQRKLPSH